MGVGPFGGGGLLLRVGADGPKLRNSFRIRIIAVPDLHRACSFVPPVRVIEIRRPISEQGNSVLERRIQSLAEFDDSGLVVIILHEVNELLEPVDVIAHRVLGLVPTGPFKFGEGGELLVLRTEMLHENTSQSLK